MEPRVGRHADLLARHRGVMPSWMTLYYDDPIALVDGEGRHVVDAEGNRYLDFFGGILTTMTGYRVPRVVEAIQDQAARMLHTSTLYLIEPQIELAERIAELSGIPDAKVFFTNSGSEANDAALMMATQFRSSDQILALRNSYHGKSHSTVAVTGNASWSATALSPFNVTYVHSGYRLRSPFGGLPEDEFVGACVDDLRDLLAVATAGDVAAMIAEPIQGVGGFVVPPDGYFAALKQVLDEHGILFIADEVQTGWGRTGDHFWGHQAHGIVPDLLTFAKGLGNGVAIAGVVGRADVVDCLPANSLSTFGGNPLAATAALANLEVLFEQDLQENARAQGQVLRDGLQRLAEDVPEIAEVRGKGLMIGIEFAAPGSLDPLPQVADGALQAARAEGLLVGKGGLHRNVLRIAPPLSITAAEVSEGLAMLERAIRSVTHPEQSA
ncbi:MAG: aspartate aminotransferase family protein [Dehalococcoidia bacterium]|nr:aspartate aminotransferase family protein [Dehalococcoidia bacterium]